MASPTVKTWLNNAASLLQSHSYTPSEAELLLGFVLNLTKADILAHPEQELTNEQAAQAEILLQRRLANEPIAYIIGRRDFFGRTFKVSPDVLIPRPDSEIIIDEAKKLLATSPTACILDVGTGSGCLIISIALETENKFTYTGLDISSTALEIAKENAASLGAQVNFLQSNLLDSLNYKNQTSDISYSLPTTNYSLVIANLPYLANNQMTEPSIQSEPELALYGGTQGLHYYQQLLRQLPRFVTKDSVILLEIDPSQEHLLDEEIKINLPTATIRYLPDLSGKTRLLHIAL
jgi:release factor glutamine methyltransferase